LTAFFAVNIDMEKQIEDLVYQLRELIPTLKGLGPSPGTGGGGTISKTASSTDRLIVALGQLSARLEKGKLSRDAEIKAVEDFTKSVEKNAKALDEEADAVAKREEARQKILADQEKAAKRAALSQKERAAEEQKDREKEKKEKQEAQRKSDSGLLSQMQANSNATKQVYNQLGYLGNTSDLLKSTFLDLTGGGLGASLKLRGLEAVTEGVTKSLASFSSAVYKGERGAMVSAKALTELGTPILKFIDTLGTVIGFASWFLPGGLLIKGVRAAGGALLSLGSKAGEAALKYNELAAEQADRLFKSFRELSAAGVNVAGGMDGVFDTLQSLGYSASQIEDFNRLLSASTGKLSLMGSTAGEGARRFADVAGGLYKSDLGRQLEMLGITAEEQRESALAYMNIQARTGQLQTKNTQQLIEESSKFARELDLAAQVTGTSRKAQQEAREAAMADSRYRAALYSAKRRGDKDEIAKLEKGGELAGLLRGLGMNEQATGVLQYTAGGGALATKESIQAAMSLGLAEVLNDPNITAVQALQKSLVNAEQQLNSFDQLNTIIAEIPGLQGNIPATIDAIERMLKLQQGATAAGFTGPDAVAKFLETEQGKRIGLKGDTDAMTKAGRDQQAAAMLQDSVVKTYNAAATINKVASETFRDAVSVFSRTVDAKPVTGGTPGSPTGTSSGVVIPPAATPVAQRFQGNQQQYYNKVYGTLLEQANKQGVANPEVIARLGAAQSSLETGYGQHLSGGQNYFGIKGGSGTGQSTKEFIDGKWVTIKDKFRGYGSMEESAADYIKFLQTNSRYKGVLASQSASEAIAAQGKSGYATDPAYGAKLADINAKYGTAATAAAPGSGYRTQTPTASAVITPGQQTPAQVVAATQNTQMAMSESQSSNSSNIRIAQIAEALLDRLDRLVDVASNQLGVSNKILKSRS